MTKVVSPVSADSYIDAEVSERMKALVMEARFPVAGAFTGYHRSFLKGTAMEFAELRNYMPGDDLRRMDWKAFARSDKFFQKEYESETNARVYFLLDTSGSMRFKGNNKEERLLYAKRIIAQLSVLFLYQGDSVGVAQEIGGHIMAQRVRGESNIHQVLAALQAQEAAGEEYLPDQLHQLTKNIPRRSMVVIVSDFLSSIDDLEESLQHLRYHAHEVSCIQVLSEREVDFQEDKSFVFRSLETESTLETNAKVIQGDFRQKMEAHLSELQALCERTQTAYHRVICEEALDESIIKLLI